jgi:hypothetical protein
MRLWDISINFQPSRTQLIPPLGGNLVRTIQVRNYAVRSTSNLPYFFDTDPIIQIKDWYAHKTMYPWLLPGFNCTLSQMSQKSWLSTPHNFNLVKTAHVATNKNTSIWLTPLKAIEK